MCYFTVVELESLPFATRDNPTGKEKKKKKKKENTLIYALEGVAHCFVVAFAVCRSNLAALRSNLIAKSSILV